MQNAVIGAGGEMAKSLLLPLLKKLGGTLSAVDKNSPPKEWDNVWQADVIWLSVPRDVIPTLLKDVQLKSNQLIIDICSIKRGLSKIIQKTGASHLSLHPLHGPYVPLNGQKWVIIKTGRDATSHPHAKTILSFLKKQDIQFLEAKSEDEHDFMIGITLSMPELLTIVLDTFIAQYTKDCKTRKPSMKKLMEWAVPASNALFSFYIHSINSSQDWLRKDLISGAHHNLVKSLQKASQKLSRLSDLKITQALNRQRRFVNNLPLEERKRVRQWIERWFVDSTQKIFSFHKRIPLKPKLEIQYKKNIKDIFPIDQGKVSVGVHGIAGCFTHESFLRLCEELNIDPEKLDLKYLVEARKVIEAVKQGKIDRGVFAMANSGSGAYVSSMHAMAKNRFEVVAVYGMEIMQCLIAHPQIRRVSQVKEVFGHPQAVSQCKRTFLEKYPQIKLRYGQDSDDTALCVKRIAQAKLPKTTATLASQVAARLYNLNILEYGMHHDPFNTTTFLVIKRK